MNAFHREMIPGSSCTRKENVDIQILVTSLNDNRKVMQAIGITIGTTTITKKWNQFSQFR